MHSTRKTFKPFNFPENMITAKELKQKYLEFFKTRGHAIIESASLIPENDPTVLFTTAGMHPLVPFLKGQAHPLGKKVADAQKCIRTGDIDEVGDETHHTFFEMMGNWSFGDYFKDKAIEFSWQFLVEELKLDRNRLAVSCFAGDDDAPRDNEAFEIWKAVGMPESRIAFLPKKDNWWGPAGETGPCGPDTEMFYWKNNEILPPETFDPEDDNWVEIWNDVFMEYDKLDDGSYVGLSQKNVDTGLGLERVTAILNGYDDNYFIDRFVPIINKIEEISGKKYDVNKRNMRIIADHIRAATFILGDERGMPPSNVDQGYVLRRLIRRTVRNLRLLSVDFSEAVTPQLAKVLIDQYSDEYPLKEKETFILSELEKEEKKFLQTLDKGLKEFEKLSSSNISGKDAFLLFQSYGFPLEMIEELAVEKDIEVDVEGFAEELKKHQELSRKGAEQKFKGGLSEANEETTKLHTATHLLGEALRKVLNNSDIKQKGSNITAERLRYDFNFDRKLTPEEKQAVEDEVNTQIGAAMDVTVEELPLQEALDSGAQCEFGAKYPERVTVYNIGDYSKEICMGPHVKNTKDLGKFKIKKEESSAAGVRRIKAVLD